MSNERYGPTGGGGGAGGERGGGGAGGFAGVMEKAGKGVGNFGDEIQNTTTVLGDFKRGLAIGGMFTQNNWYGYTECYGPGSRTAYRR